jgi:hypothetical protein
MTKLQSIIEQAKKTEGMILPGFRKDVLDRFMRKVPRENGQIPDAQVADVLEYLVKELGMDATHALEDYMDEKEW